MNDRLFPARPILAVSAAAFRTAPVLNRASGIVGVNVAVSNHVWGEHATEFLATGTAIRRLADEHRLPTTTPKPSFTLGLDF